MRYRRARVPGGTYFFTVNLAERKRTLLVDHIDDLRNAVRKVLTDHPFCIDAMVVLPDHLHAVWTLPEGDADYPTRWALIKAGFSRCLPVDERRSRSRITKEKDYAAHLDYIHYNPVKHGYVRSAAEWPYSSFHRYVEQGMYDKGWAVEPTEENFGKT